MLSRIRQRLALLRRSAAPRDEAGTDAGITLVELIVAMTLSTIVGSMTMLTFLSANTSVNVTGDRLLGTASARNILESWRTLVQVAEVAPVAANSCGDGTGVRFEWITSDDMLFYANVANRDTPDGCGAPQMIWLALRDGTLLEARYAFAVSSWDLATCRTLSQHPNATVTSAGLFTANPDGAESGDLGAITAGASPLATVTSCSQAPATIAPSQVTNDDDTAVTALMKVHSVGIGFTVTDRSGAHRQSFDTTATVFGGGAS